MRILCDAVPFGFGPISKLISVATAIGGQHEMVFVGGGCSLALAETAGVFHAAESIDTLRPEMSDRLSRYSSAAGWTVLSVMNPRFAEWAIARGFRTVVIDSLFGMWDVVPDAWLNCDGVVLQRFRGVDKRALEVLAHTRHTVVGPILDPQLQSAQRTRPSNRSVLVNLGGAEDPISEIEYVCADAIMQLLADLPVWSDFDCKILTVGPRQIQRLSGLDAWGFSVQTLHRSDFLKALSSASLFLTTPGLTATFESFAVGTPCAFLPPFNYSQYLNLDEFRDAGVAPLSTHWRDYGLGVGICPHMDEVSAVHTIEQQIQNAMRDQTLVRRLRGDVSAMVAAGVRATVDDDFSARQKEYFESLGGLGTTAAKDFVLEVLNG